MKRSAGFTLVELLLALTLMAMLMALAYGGLRAATRATDRGQAILEDSTRIRMAHQFVRKTLNQMMPLVFIQGEEQDGTRTVFEGDSRRIRYVAPMPGYLGFGGPQVQELALVPGDNGMDLILSHTLLQGFEEARMYEYPPILLLSDIQEGALSFLFRDEEGELAGWVTTWEIPEEVPVSVALDLEFTDEVYLDWPMLNSQVRVDSRAMQAANRGAGNNYTDAIRKLIDKRQGQQ